MANSIPSILDEVRPIPNTNFSIRDSVNKRLEGLDFNKVAFVAHGDLNGDIKTSVMIHLGAGWSFAGFLDKPFHKPLEGGAEVIFTT